MFFQAADGNVLLIESRQRAETLSTRRRATGVLTRAGARPSASLGAFACRSRREPDVGAAARQRRIRDAIHTAERRPQRVTARHGRPPLLMLKYWVVRR